MNTFRIGLLAGLVLAGAGVVDNLHFYFVCKDAVVKSEPLVRLDEDTVSRALDRMNLTNEQRDLLKRNISEDQKSIASLHAALLDVLRALQHKYGLSAEEWSGNLVLFIGLLLLDQRRQRA